MSVLATPAILYFLHSLPLVGALAGLSAWSGAAFTVGPFTGQTLLGALPTVLLGGLQVSGGPEPILKCLSFAMASNQERFIDITDLRSGRRAH